MTKALKILLGGVPFGRNNVGDEAILECVVKIVRDVCPDADITVSTDDGRATAEKLGVKTVELFGFAPPYSRATMEQTLRENDLFIWSGATGLSDYPEITLEMLRIAQEAGTKTVLWGVGMNNKLNPVKYTVLPGKRRTVLKLISMATLGIFDAIAWETRRRETRARGKIAARLSQADLVAIRDPESMQEVLRCGDVPGIMTGGDSALILEPTKLENVKISDAARAMLVSDTRKVGICISAQREVQNKDKLVKYFDRVVADGTTNVVFVPMNPETDSELMANLRSYMKHPERTVVIEGRFEPDEILAVAGCLDVIASSRLHLLILASILHVPIIGISRGSKVDNFIGQFGLHSVGSVEECNFEHLWVETQRLLDHRKEFEETSRKVRADLLARIDAAKIRLKEVVNS